MTWAARFLRFGSYALLGLTAAIGVTLAGVGLMASTQAGSRLVAATLAGGLQGVIGGRLTIGSTTILPGGDIELRDVEVVDPDGHLVIRVGWARARVELGGLARKTVKVELDLDRPEVHLEPDASGRLTIASAFTSVGALDAADRLAHSGDPWRGWTVELVRLGLRHGTVTWRGAGERTWLRATGLELTGAGRLGAFGVTAAVGLTGQVEVPLEGPLTVQLSARIEKSRITVPRLSLGAASSQLEMFGEWDWEAETFRTAATRLALKQADLTAAVGRRVTGGDLVGRLYAESDGQRLSAAIDLAAAEGAPGGGRVALALKTGGAGPRSIGFDVALDRLDPASLLSLAPPGRVSAVGRGTMAWPIPSPAPYRHGQVTVDSLEVVLPGFTLGGHGRWRDGGAMSGALRLAASDLGAAGAAVTALLGVALPALSGQAEATLTLGGGAATPEVVVAVQTSRSSVAGTALRDGRALLKLSGATVALEASTALDLLEGGTVSVRSAASLSPGWRGVTVTAFEAVLGGQGWSLAAPASVTFDGPRVDRAELTSGTQRLVLTGGFLPGDVADARLETELDLARLPRGLVPAWLGLAGAARGTLRLEGPAPRRTLDAQVRVAAGAMASLTGLAVKADLTWRRRSGRVELDGELRRDDGGTLNVMADLPWPTAGAASSLAVTGRIAAGGWPLQPLLRALQVDLPADGRLAGALELTGSVGAPRLVGHAAVTEGRWADLTPLTLGVTVEASGPTLQATADVKLKDEALAKASTGLPFDRASLLARPGATLSRLAHAAWTVQLEVPEVQLATLAGKAGVPAGLKGRLRGEASIGGTPAAPRGRGTLVVADGALAGYPTLGGRVAFTLGDNNTALSAELDSAGAPALRLVASVAAPVEALRRPEVQRRAALQVTAAIPELNLPGSPGKRWAVAGQVAMTLEATGTLAAPVGTLAFDGRGLKLGGSPFGDLKASVRAAAPATRFDVTLRPVGGGSLQAEGTLGASLGVQATAAGLAAAPLQLALKGAQLNAAFLAPLLPGLLRAAAGTIETELTVTGSARAPRLAGTVAVVDGKATLPSLGSFTGIRFEASLDPDGVQVKGLTIRRGDGALVGELALRGLEAAEAQLSGELVATGFTLARSGMDVATFDARVTLGGRLRERKLVVEASLARGATIRLPRKTPRTLQPLDDRPDITIGEEPPPASGEAPGGGPGSPGVSEVPLSLSIHLRVDELLVKSDKPRVLIEVRTDSTWEVTASPLLVHGTLDAGHGTFEPISGRIFQVVRGHVGFTGGPLAEAQLDLAADHEAPTAKVHATVSGTIESPILRLTSEPPLDEATLAMLIVTGRTEMNVGGTQGPAFTAQDAGMAAAMAVANKAFENQLGEKMPLDSLTLDSTSVSAGKQLTDRVRVNYVRRFDARPEKGENNDEVRVQYHLSPRWTLESRYGNSGAGGASLIWQKDY